MRHQQSRRPHLLAALTLVSLLSTPAVAESRQLILRPATNPPNDVKGAVDLTIVPPFDDAGVKLTVDGQTVVDGLRSPWHLPVDFGPLPAEHTIAIIATGADREGPARSRRGHLPEH